MRIEAWDALGLSYPRVILVSASAGLGVAILVDAFGSGLIGQLATVLGVAMGLTLAYLIATGPKRELEKSALIQAAEAPALAASAAVYLHSSSSICKTLISLGSQEERLSLAFLEMRKGILLGGDPSRLADKARKSAFSESVGRVLQATVSSQAYRLEEEGNELEGMVNASALGEEAKTPVFIAFAFFVPIMSLLFAAISRVESPEGLLGLALLDIFLLDLVLAISTSGRSRQTG